MSEVAAFINQLRASGVLINLEGNRLHVEDSERVLTRQHRLALVHFKPQIVAILKGDSADWPEECLESRRRFGQDHAILFPLLNKQVETPRGAGRLVRVFKDSAGVVLEDEPSRVEYFPPGEVWLLDIARKGEAATP